jgi:addiction module RelE/StbE family toxin
MIYNTNVMWEIYESKQLLKSVQKLPDEVLKRYEKWKDVVRVSGPQGLKQIKGFHDESLQGKWQGYRSSRLGIQYRVLYCIKKTEIFVEVVDITSHDYRRK